MQFTCKCLNFMIDASGVVEPVDSTLKSELSSRAQKQDLLLVTYESIIKKIDVLVGLSRHNEWTEFHCQNCSVWMYTCRNRESDSPDMKAIIVNKSALSTPMQIDEMKRDNEYSPVFKIKLFHDFGEDITSGYREPLHPIARSWLQEQREQAEIRIKKFADHQYGELEKKKARAYSDHFAIQRAVVHDRSLQPPGTSREPVRHSVVGLSKPLMSPPRVPIMPKESSPADGLQDLDESIIFESQSPHESAVSEGSDDDIIDLPQSRRAEEPMAMARSLPIPVPIFMEERRHDDRHDKSPQTPTDIHANIKALARSVHGNPIFGELPRPRFTKD